MKNSPVKLKCSREYHKKVKLTIQTLPQIAGAKRNLVGGAGGWEQGKEPCDSDYWGLFGDSVF